ncbi:hypothetical protein [Cytobacillus gottheilii]|uniref:hypothetical protein n=1 Tax=Cytobacillus gottheilii TaxID=859144 RepID=UPI0009BBB0E0|nr:hypothetical protein [Cytobacillus gottheilii]
MGFAKEEQETSLVFEADTGKWIGYSCFPPHITKIVKLLGIDNVVPTYEDGRESPLSIKFELKGNQVSFRKGEKREMSEEQRLAASERMKNLHKNK